MAEPIGLNEALANLRVTSSAEGDLITGLIIAAREYIEGETGLVLVQRQIVETLRGFDRCGYVDLRRRPVFSDSASAVVAYADPTGIAGTVMGFRLLPSSLEGMISPARLYPAFGSRWPATYCSGDAVTITYTAGFAAPADVLQSIKQVVHLLIGHWYSNRSAVEAGVRAAAIEVPFTVDNMLDRWRLKTI